MKSKINFGKLKKIPVFMLMIIMFILSSRTQPIPPPGEYYIDYFYAFLHMGEFGLFTMFLMLGFYSQIKLYYLVVFSVLYGVLDEVYQYFIPTRFFDVVDILSNSIGVILGVIGYFLLVSIYCYFKFAKKPKKIDYADDEKELPKHENGLNHIHGINSETSVSDSKSSEQKHSKYGYPKVVCYECKKKRGIWCKKFKMSIQLALRTDCDYGTNMDRKNKKE